MPSLNDVIKQAADAFITEQIGTPKSAINDSVKEALRLYVIDKGGTPRENVNDLVVQATAYYFTEKSVSPAPISFNDAVWRATGIYLADKSEPVPASFNERLMNASQYYIDNGGASPSPGLTATVLPTAPTVHYHPHTSGATLSSGRVVSANDLMALAGVTEGAAGIGPKEMTDALGRKFWRFEGAEYLNIATALESVSTQAMATFFVGRFHLQRTSNPIWGLGRADLATTTNTTAPCFATASNTNVAQGLRCVNRFGVDFDTNPVNSLTGSQMQVIGAVSRNSGNGGIRFNRNKTVTSNTAALTATSATSVAGSGAEIGRYPHAPSTSGNWGQFDLYELVIYKGAAGGVLTNAQADAIAEALTDNWAIPALEHTVVLEGDSLTNTTAYYTSGNMLAMVLTDPGQPWALPANWLVQTAAGSGQTVANLVTRRDTAKSWPNYKIAGGRSVVAVHIGANNFSGGTGASIYAAICDLIDAITTGYQQQGWETACAVNTALQNASNWPKCQDLRVLLRDIATFRTDCGGLTAQQLRLMELPLITVGGQTIFETNLDAGDTTYYHSDGLHFNAEGTRRLAIGGDNLTNGYAQRIVATS